MCNSSIRPYSGQAHKALIISGIIFCLIIFTFIFPAQVYAGKIVEWGDNRYGQCNVPSPNTDFVAIAAGIGHSLGLKADGSIVSWGDNKYGQCDIPSSNTDFIAVAAGGYYSLGLKADGSIVTLGQYRPHGPNEVPFSSPNTGFTAIAASFLHSLGLKDNGSIVAWGDNYYGQSNVPSPNTDFVAIAAGAHHSLGLKADGSMVVWGLDAYGLCNIPSPNADFVAIAAGGAHCLGLKADGSIVAWGYNYYGECNIPSPNSGFIAIAAGFHHNLGLKADGSIVAWGRNEVGQCSVPSPNAGFVAIAAGGWYCSLGLKNTAGLANAGPDQTAYAYLDGITEVALDGSDSNDPDGDTLTYHWLWTIDSNTYEANGVSPTIELPVGLHTIELVVNDGLIDSAPDYVDVNVVAPLKADLRIMPAAVNRRSNLKNIMAVMELPRGIKRTDVSSEKFILLPSGGDEGIKAVLQVVLPFPHRIKVLAMFDKNELSELIPANGRIKLQVVGQLKSGQYVFGEDSIWILGKRR
jgi:hypothetical protein